MKESLSINLYKQPPNKINLVTRVLDVPVQLHMHNFYEIELVTSGTGVNRINGMPFQITPGLMYLLTPNDTHQTDVNGSLSLIHIGFLPDPANGLAVPLPKGGYSMQLPPEDMDTALSFFRIVEAECSRVDAYRFQGAYAALSLLLIRLLRDGRPCASPPSFQKIQQALLYIWEHCSEESTCLENVSRHCGLTPSYFSYLFHKTFGSSFSAYLTDCRLRCACYLLSDTDISVTNVVYESGFSSPSRFFRVFRARYGCTPGEYREKHEQIASIPIEEQVPISLWQSGEWTASSRVDTNEGRQG